jgi:hypothetical protein
LSIVNAWLVIERQSVHKQRVEGQYLAACAVQSHTNLQLTNTFLNVGCVRDAEERYESNANALELYPLLYTRKETTAEGILLTLIMDMFFSNYKSDLTSYLQDGRLRIVSR